jgi:hypothetical protein
MPVSLKRRVKAFARRRGGVEPQRLMPPAAAPGAIAAPPDYIGIGAMKSGTTWWAGLLAAHPSVAPVITKELHFFDFYFTTEFTDEDRDLYWDFFARPPGTVAGEWTPRYMYDFWTPALLRRSAPDAKLLVILRDPIERYASGLAHHAHRFRREPAWMAQDHFGRGLYHEQLSRTFAHFPREQVLVLQFERCVQDPRAELARTHRFLGWDDTAPFPEAEAAPKNSSKRAKPVLPTHVVHALRDRYRDDLQRLFELIPDLDPGLWSTTLADGRRAPTG